MSIPTTGTSRRTADDVAEVQRLWLAGDREAAAERVPIEIGLGANLIGPPDELRRRLHHYRNCGVNTLRIHPIGDTLDLVKAVNDDPAPNTGHAGTKSADEEPPRWDH